MALHLPYSEMPADEFQAPSGEWLPTLRAITFDNWLLWKHALPEDLSSWSRLDEAVYETIQRLARRIHNVHQLLPDYKQLLDTPFTVSRWWDPSDESGEWSTGARLLCKVAGYSAASLQAQIPARLCSELTLQPRSTHWLEISLPPPPPLPPEVSGSPAPPPARPARPGCPIPPA